VTTLAGNGIQTPFANGPATSATFNDPLGVAVGISGQVYVADWVRGRMQQESAGWGEEIDNPG
jgi:hypothetical protein